MCIDCIEYSLYTQWPSLHLALTSVLSVSWTRAGILFVNSVTERGLKASACIKLCWLVFVFDSKIAQQFCYRADSESKEKLGTWQKPACHSQSVPFSFLIDKSIDKRYDTQLVLSFTILGSREHQVVYADLYHGDKWGHLWNTECIYMHTNMPL